MKINEIFEDKKLLNKETALSGWIKYKRISKSIGFLTINDGSDINGIQVVFKREKLNEDDFNKLVNLNLFSPISLKGKIVKNSNNNSIEIELINFSILNTSDNEFILGKKEHGLEFLRENAHIRIKTSLFQAIMRIRSYLYSELISFFDKEGFFYVSAPIITSNDAEGAGETFKLVKNDNKSFFSNKNGVLSVSGQLHAESYAQSLGKVYTFAPTFRAENSTTSRHAAEFWMLEPEIAFFNYFDAMDLGEKMLKSVILNVLKRADAEFVILEKTLDSNLRKNLKDICEKEFKKIKYEEAVSILKEAIESKKVKFDNNNIYFGVDFGTEHERYLVEKHFKLPIYIYDFPFEIKSFYMYRNDEGTVRGFDLLVPGIGELIGGSQREENYERLIDSIREKDLNIKDLDWYLNLRKLGYAPSSGFGLGFERFIMFVTGVENIRDVIPFPRTPGKLKF